MLPVVRGNVKFEKCAMASVVFLRAANVGGHQTFHPKTLANDLAAFRVVNIGAAGTFVVRDNPSRVGFPLSRMVRTSKARNSPLPPNAPGDKRRVAFSGLVRQDGASVGCVHFGPSALAHNRDYAVVMLPDRESTQTSTNATS